MRSARRSPPGTLAHVGHGTPDGDRVEVARFDGGLMAIRDSKALAAGHLPVGHLRSAISGRPSPVGHLPAGRRAPPALIIESKAGGLDL